MQGLVLPAPPEVPLCQRSRNGGEPQFICIVGLSSLRGQDQSLHFEPAESPRAREPESHWHLPPAIAEFKPLWN